MEDPQANNKPPFKTISFFPENIASVEDSALAANLIAQPGPQIKGDPITYKYHPRSSLSLGRGFLPENVISPCMPSILFEEVPLDHGSPSTHFSLQYVKTEDELDLAIALDTKVEASLLGAKGAGSSTFKSSFTMRKNSIVAVATISIDFGRFGINPKAELSEEAKSLLSKPKEFVRIYGSRFVSIERRGAAASVIISIDEVQNDLKIDFENSFSGSGNFGDSIGGSASMKFNLMFKTALKQSRLRVDAVTTGGSGPSALVDSLLALVDLENATTAIHKVLSTFLGQFNKDNAVPIEYMTAPMSQFKLDELGIDPWTDDKERLLTRYCRDYRNALTLKSLLPSVISGTHIFCTMLPPDTVEMLKNLEPQLDELLSYLSIYHEALKTGSGPQGELTQHFYPPNFHYFINRLEEAETPPTLTMSAPLNPQQLRAVLRSNRGKRYEAALQFDETITPEISIIWGLNAHYGLFSAQEICEYSDGHKTIWDETPISTNIGFLWVTEPRNATSIATEDLWFDWFAKHQGVFDVKIYLNVRDKADRTFTIRLFDTHFEAHNGTLTNFDIQMYY